MSDISFIIFLVLFLFSMFIGIYTFEEIDRSIRDFDVGILPFLVLLPFFGYLIFLGWVIYKYRSRVVKLLGKI
jgi:hypothetical protein